MIVVHITLIVLKLMLSYILLVLPYTYSCIIICTLSTDKKKRFYFVYTCLNNTDLL